MPRGGAVGAIHQLYRGKLHVLAVVPSKAAARQHASNMLLASGANPKAVTLSPLAPPPVNACVASMHTLSWVPDKAVDGAITFGALSRLKSRTRLCGVFREVMQSQEERIRALCRLLDADGDGTIDFSEFAQAMSAQGDDLRKGTSGVLREREQKQLQQITRSQGRFGATPSLAYGVQVRELLNGERAKGFDEGPDRKVRE